MRFGVVLPESVLPEYDSTLRALDAFAERSRMPDVFPVWSRGYRLDRRLLDGIRARDVEPVVYVEDPNLAVAVDTLRLFACRAGDGTKVRWNQEANGKGLLPAAKWQAWSPDTYRGQFERVFEVMHTEAAVESFYCPQGRRKPKVEELSRWQPKSDLVGFDWYDVTFPTASIEWCSATRHEAWVGETGWPAGVKGGVKWLRSLSVVDVDAIVIMNLPALRPDGGVDDWTWSPSMERAFREIVE